ncbi:hypothetical protein QAD02_020270 [Eretmocerus hayati]|uniref:Uncharacterized protein n=1 Tax=Eretmocerus hayati TaxID=131215 RepID=A0ACC2PN71_9HYME|nr:hypothetical protein QAD02_020270 [Eretmocerus hayati]
MSGHRSNNKADQPQQQQPMQGHSHLGSGISTDEKNDGPRLEPDLDDDGPDAVQYFEIGEGTSERDGSERGSRGARDESTSSAASPVPSLGKLEQSAREDHGYAPLLQINQHQHHHEKTKSPSLLELGPGSQVTLNGTMKTKCQCHALQEQQQQRFQSSLRVKRDSAEDPTRAGHNREPPALPPRPPLRPSGRRYELPSSTSAEQRQYNHYMRTLVPLLASLPKITAAQTDPYRDSSEKIAPQAAPFQLSG